ncbi:MAG: PPOX class F420-dependent oxidoreductase [Anaerolineae bacterium]
MKTMSDAEYKAFMLGTARTGKLATVREDGRPHVAPIWFDMDGDVIVFTTWETTVKGKNIHRDGRVSLCVDDDKPPFAFVIIDGTAEIVTLTAEEMLHWTTRIARRYMGDELAESYGKRNAVPGELLIRLTPTRVNAQTRISD